MLTRLHFYISTSTFVRSEADIMHRLFSEQPIEKQLRVTSNDVTATYLKA